MYHVDLVGAKEGEDPTPGNVAWRGSSDYKKKFVAEKQKAIKEIGAYAREHLLTGPEKFVTKTFWTPSPEVIDAYIELANKHRRSYPVDPMRAKETFKQWWYPNVKRIADKKVFGGHSYRDIELTFAAMRNVRKKGLIHDIIYRPWEVTNLSHENIIDKARKKGKDFALTVALYAVAGVFAYGAVTTYVRTKARG